MQWQSSADGGWEITFAEGCAATIKLSPNRGAVRWRLKIDGRAGSILSAQAKVEALVGELGLDVEGKVQLGQQGFQPG